MSAHVGDEPLLGRTNGETDAYVALLRREQQVEAMQATLGWRLLSYYGPYKRRFVLPAWRRLRHLVGRWFQGPTDRAGDAYEGWARFTDRLRGVGYPTAVSSEVVTLVLIVDAASWRDADRVIASVRAQHHEAWELLLGRVGDTGALAALDDGRVRLDPGAYATRVAALNALVPQSAGSIVAVVPPEVVLAPDALTVACEAFRTTGADVLYGDEDQEDVTGRRHTPRFNPGWSPDLLLARMYWPRVVFHRRASLMRILPLAEDGAEAEGHACALLITERPSIVVHVPRVLSHTRDASSVPSREEPSRDAGQQVLAAALARRGIAGTVEPLGEPGLYRVRRAILAPARVSIIIPTRDGLSMLRRCLAAVERTHHADFEIAIVDNGSRDAATLAFLDATAHQVIRAPGPFNFSRLNNHAVPQTTGRYLVFLNDDTEPCGPDWLQALEEHAQRAEVGAVGAKLLYADGRIQHAGIAVGIGGLAGHPHRFRPDAPDGIRNVSAVTAACLMMRRESFEAIGGFDERLPVNSNDVDLCLRLRARGHLVVYTPHAVLRHFESQTRGPRARPDDAWLMTRRWRDVLRDDPYYSPNLDRAEESGAPDLSKPDGMMCLYRPVAGADGSLRLDAGQSAGQTFYATGPQLTAIVLHAAVDGIAPERAFRLVVRQTPDAEDDVRIVERAIRGRTGDEWWLCFEPIADSIGRFWYFRIEVAAGHAITLQRRSVASDVMGPCFEDDVPAHGTLSFEAYARAPYRCATTP